MIKLNGFKSEVKVLGNGNRVSKSLREKLINSIDSEIDIVKKRVIEKNENWFELEKIEKSIKGEKKLVNENRFWRYNDKSDVLECQLKLKGISFKYGKELKNRENCIYYVDLDESGDNILLWLNGLKGELEKMDDNDEMFVNEEKNIIKRKNVYRSKNGLELIK